AASSAAQVMMICASVSTSNSGMGNSFLVREPGRWLAEAASGRYPLNKQQWRTNHHRVNCITGSRTGDEEYGEAGGQESGVGGQAGSACASYSFGRQVALILGLFFAWFVEAFGLQGLPSQ